MATLLDVGLIQKFDIIFPFLLVLVVIWGVLSYSKFLGGNKITSGLIALVLAMLVLVSDAARNIINSMAPWFVVLFIFVLFVIMAFKIFGVTDSDIMSVLKQEEWIAWILFGLLALIFIYSIADVLVWSDEESQLASEISGGGSVGEDSRAAVFSTLRSPQVLGLLIIFLVATFAVQKLSKT